MSDTSPAERNGQIHDGYEADAPIGAVRESTGVRWLTILVWFMRLAAVFWLLRGIMHWVYIIGLGEAGFPDLRLSRQGIVMAMAVMDLVAAVGMWLTASWGVAVWLIVLFAEAAIPYFVPDMPFAVSEVVVAVAAGLIYLVLVWQAAREQRAIQ